MTKDFDLPPTRRYVHLKIAADPEYTLYFNGRAVGGHRGGDPKTLDVYDVTKLAHDRSNRIVVAVRSRTGAGGLIVSVDLAPDLENAVTTDESWRTHHQWSDTLLTSDAATPAAPARVLGQPPFGKWNYLVEKRKELFPKTFAVLTASREIPLRSSVPEIRAIGGIVIRTLVPVDARAFDFGFVRGRVRLETPPEGGEIRVTYANLEGELVGEGEIQSFISAPGETSVTDPTERNFRFVIVYGNGSRASVLVPASE